MKRERTRSRQATSHKLAYLTAAALLAAAGALIVHTLSWGAAETAPLTSVETTQLAMEVVLELPAEPHLEVVEPESPSYLRTVIPLEETLQAELWSASEEFGIDYAILVALIDRETDFRNIKGDEGDSYGYCQIQPKWWSGLMEEIGAEDLMDPRDNFRTAGAILASLIDRHGNIEDALTAYNTGKPGTSDYATDIIRSAEQWR